MLGLMLNASSAQAQQKLPSTNGAAGTNWVMVDDQIVPAAAIVGSNARKDLDTLALFPNARKWPGGRVFYTYDANMSAAK